MKKILLFISVLIVSIFTLNIRLFASNSYYLMSCAEQNIPTGYYDSVNTSSEDAMRESLYNIVSTGYIGGSYNNAWVVDSYADADPYNEGNILCIYTGQSISKNKHGSGGWDREHIWCKSHGFKFTTSGGSDSSASSNHAYNDCHHLRAADHTTNNLRSDKDFGEVENPTASNDYGCKWTESIFEPNDEVKGDVARMLFYMMIHYGEYNTNPQTTYVKTDQVDSEGKAIYEVTTVYYNLSLVDEDTTTTSTGNGRLGKLSTLLKWHYQDPVSDREIYRNNVVYLFQNNRNPFIDHPEYVDIAFENAIGSYTAPTSNIKESDTKNRTEVLYKTVGFESSEGFVAQDTFNSNYIFGNIEEQWHTNYAAVATSGALSGNQSMQMRWFSGTSRYIPVASMAYDVDNLSRVEFTAKGVAGGKIAVMYSYDQGATWHTKEEIAITTSKATYSSTISSNGGLGNLRVGFKMILPEGTSSDTTYYIDDVKLYRAKDSIGEEMVKYSTKSNISLKYDSELVNKATTEYRLVTDTSQLSVGDEIIIDTYYTDKNGDHLFAMGDRTGVRMSGVSASLRDNVILSDTAIKMTLEAGTLEGTYSLKWNNQYLGNASSSSYQLIPYASKSDTTSFTFTIENGVSYLKLMSTQTLKDDGTVDKKPMEIQFNSKESYFACYRGTQKAISIYKKVVESKNVTEYTFNETYLRFGGIITKDLCQDILTQDSNATFGIALSKDGSTYTPYACTVTLANLVEGKLVDNVNGDYAYFAVKVLTPKEHFNDTVYAKAYVIINSETFYMQESSHSVTELVNYYLNNVTLTIDEQDLLGGLIQ